MFPLMFLIKNMYDFCTEFFFKSLQKFFKGRHFLLLSFLSSRKKILGTFFMVNSCHPNRIIWFKKWRAYSIINSITKTHSNFVPLLKRIKMQDSYPVETDKEIPFVKFHYVWQYIFLHNTPLKAIVCNICWQGLCWMESKQNRCQMKQKHTVCTVFSTLCETVNCNCHTKFCLFYSLFCLFWSEDFFVILNIILSL